MPQIQRWQIRNYIPHKTTDVITCSYFNLSQSQLINGSSVAPFHSFTNIRHGYFVGAIVFMIARSRGPKDMDENHQYILYLASSKRKSKSHKSKGKKTSFKVGQYKQYNINFHLKWVLVAAWWRHQMEKFPRYWPFVRGIHRSPVNSSHKGQWRGALIFFFDLHPNKRLSKQWRGWWFETL